MEQIVLEVDTDLPQRELAHKPQYRVITEYDLLQLIEQGLITKVEAQLWGKGKLSLKKTVLVDCTLALMSFEHHLAPIQ